MRNLRIDGQVYAIEAFDISDETITIEFNDGWSITFLPVEATVEPEDGHEFTGTVIGVKDGKYLQVQDQEDNVWDSTFAEIREVVFG